MPLGLRMATPDIKELVCSAGVEKESVTAVQHAFHTQSDMKSPSQVPIYVCWKTFRQKLCI